MNSIFVFRAVNAPFFAEDARQDIWPEKFYAERALVSGPKVWLLCLGANGEGGGRGGGGGNTDQYTFSRDYLKDHRSLYDGSPTPTSLVP